MPFLSASVLARKYTCDLSEKEIDMLVRFRASSLSHIFASASGDDIVTKRIILRFAGLPIRRNRLANMFLSLSFEGILQGLSVQYNLLSLPTKHGAPIPIKRITDETGRIVGYASTFPLILKCNGEKEECWEGDANQLYVPYKGRYARAEITEDGIKIAEPLDIKYFDEFLMTTVNFRGNQFAIYYDYLLLGKKPPSSVVDATFNPRRGPLRHLYTPADVLAHDIMYIFATIDNGMIDGAELIEKMIEEHPGGFGWQGSSMIIDYEIFDYLTETPLDFLFAKDKDGYVLLRPLPVRLWDRDDIVWGYSHAVVPSRVIPPYFIVHNKKYMEQVLLPGAVVKKLPYLAYEVK